MNATTQTKATKIATGLIIVIIVLVPFQAFLTVWAASIFGHYTAWRLWDEILLSVGGILGLGLLWLDNNLWPKLKRQPIFWLIVAYIMLQLVTGFVSLNLHDVNAKALGYGLIVNLRFLLFFLLCLVVAARSTWLKRDWQKILLIPAAIIVAFGLLQHFVLPYDFLKHFGYNMSTIFPYETVNQNLKYVRVMSTLRGANPLGAYLIIVLAALTALFIKTKTKNWRLVYGIFGLAAASTLFFSYSRSAWLGAALGVVLVLGLSIQNSKVRRGSLIGLAALVVIVGLGALLLRNNVHVENIITHTQHQSTVKTTSDQGHASALKAGLKDVIHQPFGRGPGTAGPASTYNNHPARLAENYFIQVAQEVGWLGLVVFLAINWFVAKGLWADRKDPLSLFLLASLAGITLVNLLSHAWTDDTLSYIWWGLAGIALSKSLIGQKNAKAA